MKTASTSLDMENFQPLGYWGINPNLSDRTAIASMKRLTLCCLLFGEDLI